MLHSPRYALGLLLAGLALLICVSPQLRAADDDMSKPADVTGTWKWTMQGRGNNSQPREMVLKLKQDGEKVTGTLTAFNNETEIKDGMIKDGTLSFTVTRTFNEQEFTTKYSGKVEGDTIKGKSEMTRNGQARERDWEAKRASDSSTTEPS